MHYVITKSICSHLTIYLRLCSAHTTFDLSIVFFLPITLMMNEIEKVLSQSGWCPVISKGEGGPKFF